MSADKRSTYTDALASLGTLDLGENPGRDAIHLAVEPCIAGERLFPGQDIGLVDGKASPKAGKLLGIVDPFIKGQIIEGERFWLIVYPRQITSLRHVWSHPDFEESKQTSLGNTKAMSEKWLRDWCATCDDAPTYEDLIAVMTGGKVSESEGYGARWVNQGDYLLSHGIDAYGEIPLEVWVHVENVIGKKLDSYPAHFSCSC